MCIRDRPDDVVKDRFDRLLKEVQTISSEKAKCYEGKVVPVLAEAVSYTHLDVYKRQIQGRSSTATISVCIF